MPTRRGWASALAGASLWVTGRVIGSPDLQMIGVGITILPLLAIAFVRWSRVRLDVQRHLSAVRVFPGTRVKVSLTVENQGRTTTSFLLLEDALPATIGRPARLVVSGVPPRNAQTVAYQIMARQRGRYTLGPLYIYVTDPFGLARSRVEAPVSSELIVYPEVETIDVGRLAVQGAGAGESTVRQLLRSAAEFYTMREYQTGDDLRRIHWPSVARTGRLMIRQDESTRRSTANVFLDNRASALGAHGTPALERAVSAAASLGRGLLRAGFSLRLAAADLPARPVDEESLLEALASISDSRARGLSPALTRLRATSSPDTTLAVITAPLPGPDLAALTRVGAAFGRKIAVMVYPVSPARLAQDAAAELEARASSARASLQRAGWEVFLIHPDGRLSEAWHLRKIRALQPIASSS